MKEGTSLTNRERAAGIDFRGGCEGRYYQQVRKSIKHFYKQHVRNQSLMGISRDLTSNVPDTAVVGAGGMQGAGFMQSLQAASGEDSGLGGP